MRDLVEGGGGGGEVDALRERKTSRVSIRRTCGGLVRRDRGQAIPQSCPDHRATVREK